MMILTIARHEIRSMFLSPLAWIILAVNQTLLGYMFLAQVDNFYLLQPQLMSLENTPGVTDIVVAPLFQLAAIILLMIAIFAMNLTAAVIRERFRRSL